MGVVANPHKPSGAVSHALAQGRRPDFPGRCRSQQFRMEKKAVGIDLGSQSSSVSSGWMYIGPEIEAQVPPEGPAHPCYEGRENVGMVNPTTDGAVAGTNAGVQGDNGCYVPPSLLAEVKKKTFRASAHSTMLPEWGCFRPVALPPRLSSTQTHFQEKPRKQDGSGGGEERSYRFDVSTRLGKETPIGSPRARQQATLLSAAMRDILYGVKSGSRPGRARLLKAYEMASDEGNNVLNLASGARMGLCVLSALKDVVVDEGKVFEGCFRELVRQERSACRQRGELLEVMRGHYARLLEEVVEHLSKLKASLIHTVDEEARLKQQSHCVQRLAQLLAEDAKIDRDHRQKLDSMAPTELDRFIDARHGSSIAKADLADGTRVNIAEKACDVTRTRTVDDDSAGEIASKPIQRESVESLEGLLSEVRSGPPEGTRNNNSVTERSRHIMASLKVDMLQDMIEERVAVRREKERREKWRQYNAATTIKNWWRKINPPEWEEADRQYAATLIQAHIRAKIARLTRMRVLEQFRATKGAIALQNVYRRYLAVRERKRRAQIVQVSVGATYRILDKAVGELEAKASAMQSAEQASKVMRTSPESKAASTSKSRTSEESSAEPATGQAAIGAVSGTSDKSKERTISSLVRRLNALGQVLDQWEDGRCRNVSEELCTEDGRRSRQNSAASSSSVAGVGRRRVARRRP